MSSNVQFYDTDVEERILKILITDSSKSHLFETLDTTYFSQDDLKLLFSSILLYYRQYGAIPDEEILSKWANNELEEDEAVEVLNTYADVFDMEGVKSDSWSFLFNELKEYKLLRGLYTLTNTLSANLGHKSAQEIIRSATTDLVLLEQSVAEVATLRGSVYERVKQRWETYKQAEIAPGKIKGIPYGIVELDNVTGGLHETHIVLFYGQTGSGKSRMLINIGFNIASLGIPVMYMSLEMSTEMLDRCIDSRGGLLDFTALERGQLFKEERKQYLEYLKAQYNDKTPFYIVDLPDGATTATVQREMELYEIKFGQYPPVLLIDYAGLMEPSGPYNGRSEKYDIMFNELHQITRKYNTRLLSAVQESRTSDEEKGVRNIGLSHYIAPHCEVVFQLTQDEFEAADNVLNINCDKNRYGEQKRGMHVFVYWELNYIGDRKILFEEVG